ncbi:hypothetical protein NC653_014667 [Populus alba x Populus x berolinensis]|uniref:Uncharacterized protein n=1 Tax=Populus alba x Populus x berolinensis TaxID=444605 RepID=A0AAD6W4Q3_9ROSI|nr:hypothetical protein NC653_014667 [Populus alba x Populus x berolinensis]
MSPPAASFTALLSIYPNRAFAVHIVSNLQLKERASMSQFKLGGLYHALTARRRLRMAKPDYLKTPFPRPCGMGLEYKIPSE